MTLSVRVQSTRGNFSGTPSAKHVRRGALSPQGMAVGSVVGGYAIPPPLRFG
jgi:hypothetical protein